MAVASDQDARSQTGGTLVVGDGGGNLMGGERGRPGRSQEEAEHGHQGSCQEPVTREREESCFLRGRLSIEAALLRGESLPLGRFVPQPWPSQLRPLLKVVSGWLKRQREKQRQRREKARRKQRKREQRRRQKTYP